MMRKRIFEKTYCEKLRTLVCQDCGQTLETAESPSQCLCPNCGGKRMNIKLFPVKKEEPVSRKSVFENHDTPLESKLKTFSGKVLSDEDFQKEFSDSAESLLQKEYATVVEEGIQLRSDAYGIEKAFSKLIISVTKTLELNPSIMSGNLPISEGIKRIPGLQEKGIMILKKAHNLPDEIEVEKEEKEDWVKDSNICEDLKEEFGGQTFGLEEFIKIIRERYPDAPRDIYETLEDRGAISLDGTKVNILH